MLLENLSRDKITTVEIDINFYDMRRCASNVVTRDGVFHHVVYCYDKNLLNQRQRIIEQLFVDCRKSFIIEGVYLPRQSPEHKYSSHFQTVKE